MKIAEACFLFVMLVSTAASPANLGPSGSTFISTLNSTTTTLSGDGVFTGAAETVAGYSQISCFMKSDVASANNGWSMELSTDGVNWDRKKETTTKGGRSQAHVLAVVSEYFRVVFTNGSSSQTYFRLECMYNTTQSSHLVSSVSETISANSDVNLVRVVGTHQLDTARGIIDGHTLIRKFGHNADVGSTEEAVWSLGGSYTGFLTTAGNIEVVSSSANDKSGSTGALTVRVYGLDENFSEINEVFTMDGTAAVVAVTETSWIRVIRVVVEDSLTYSTGSSNGSNVGLITVKVASAGATLATIDAQAGQSELAIYTVPLGKTAFLSRVEINVSIAANKQATVTMWQRPNADDTSTPFTGRKLIQVWNDINGREMTLYSMSIPFYEKTDVWFSAVRSSSTNALVDVHFELHVVPNLSTPAVP